MNPYMNNYQQNQILTASREQILLMLYDGAIRFCRQAIKAGEDNDIVFKLERISKVLAIVAELSNSLNHQIGGEIATDLDALYNFIMRELNKARTDETQESLRTVEKLLVDLRGTWKEAIDLNKQEQAAQAMIQSQESVQLSRRLTAAG